MYRVYLFQITMNARVILATMVEAVWTELTAIRALALLAILESTVKQVSFEKVNTKTMFRPLFSVVLEPTFDLALEIISVLLLSLLSADTP